MAVVARGSHRSRLDDIKICRECVQIWPTTKYNLPTLHQRVRWWFVIWSSSSTHLRRLLAISSRSGSPKRYLTPSPGISGGWAALVLGSIHAGHLASEK